MTAILIALLFSAPAIAGDSTARDVLSEARRACDEAREVGKLQQKYLVLNGNAMSCRASGRLTCYFPQREAEDVADARRDHEREYEDYLDELRDLNPATVSESDATKLREAAEIVPSPADIRSQFMDYRAMEKLERLSCYSIG